MSGQHQAGALIKVSMTCQLLLENLLLKPPILYPEPPSEVGSTPSQATDAETEGQVE